MLPVLRMLLAITPKESKDQPFYDIGQEYIG